MKRITSLRFSNHLVISFFLLVSCNVMAQRMQIVKDFDGNTYHTVKIGDQIWMVENLKTTHFRNGTAIPNVTDNNEWTSLKSPAYCTYQNKPANKEKYGLLYNFYAVSDSTNNLAPTGWRVANNEDWKTLQTYLIKNKFNFDKSTDGAKFGKALAAKTDWILTKDDFGGAVGDDLSKNNATGFTALPAGYRYDGGLFYDIGCSAYWWTSTENKASVAWYKSMRCDYWGLFTFRDVKTEGFSVRCVKEK
jgi:uncharacterized protein (TIGR02145 family)